MPLKNGYVQFGLLNVSCYKVLQNKIIGSVFMKKYFIGIIVLICLMMILCFNASASPVLSEEKIVTQKIYGDFTVIPYGDEYCSYYVSDDGYIVIQEQNEFWYYATISSCEEQGVAADKIISSGFRYKLDPVPPLAI